jgi:hypothetical protein
MTNSNTKVLVLILAMLFSGAANARQGDALLPTRQFDLTISRWNTAPEQTRMEYISGVLAVLTRLELACPVKFTANDLATMLRTRVNVNKTPVTQKFVIGVLEVLIHDYGCSLNTNALKVITLE